MFRSKDIVPAKWPRRPEAWESAYQWIMPHARAFVLSRGGTAERAEDFAQEFFVALVIDRGLTDRLGAAADGRLALLRKALHDFSVEKIRQRAAEGRRLNRIGMRAPHTGHSAPPLADREWATRIVRAAVNRTELYCRHRKLERHWIAFEARILWPALFNTKPPAVKDLAKSVGAKRGDDVSSMLQQVKERFVRHVLEIMGVTSACSRDREYHLRSLLAMLGGDPREE